MNSIEIESGFRFSFPCLLCNYVNVSWMLLTFVNLFENSLEQNLESSCLLAATVHFISKFLANFKQYFLGVHHIPYISMHHIPKPINGK